jgi:CBS domain-containing protein
VTLPADAPVGDAVRAMRERDVGTVLVLDHDKLAGVVTDRDIVVRAVAYRTDLSDCHLADVCSSDLVAATSQDDVDTAIARMRQKAVHRVVVVEDGRPVGVFSLGDAAQEKDPDSALGDSSGVTANT